MGEGLSPEGPPGPASPLPSPHLLPPSLPLLSLKEHPPTQHLRAGQSPPWTTALLPNWLPASASPHSDLPPNVISLSGRSGW